MPASLQARTTRTAISPRFATSTLVRGRGSAVTVGLAVGLSVDAPVTRQLLLGGGGRSLGGGPGRQSRARSRRRNAATPAAAATSATRTRTRTSVRAAASTPPPG